MLTTESTKTWHGHSSGLPAESREPELYPLGTAGIASPQPPQRYMYARKLAGPEKRGVGIPTLQYINTLMWWNTAHFGFELYFLEW